MKQQIIKHIICGMCVHGQVIHSHFPETNHTCIPNSCVENMLTFGTYNTNVSREPELSKHRHTHKYSAIHSINSYSVRDTIQHYQNSCMQMLIKCRRLIDLIIIMSRLL